MKRPAFQFYPKDWRNDLALRSCSIAARGLWVDLMCLMHDGEPYGHLALDGEAMPDLTVASVVGLPLTTYRELLREIEGRKVASRTAAGLLFSRRMVRDHEIREIRAQAGSLGGQSTHRSGVFAQAKSQANAGQSSEQSVAAANGVGSGSPEGGAGETLLGPVLLAAITSTPDRWAVIEFLERLPASQPAFRWVARLAGYLDGLDMPGGRRATPAAIATACRDYQGDYSPAHFRRFVDRAMREAKPKPAEAAAKWLDSA